MYKYYLETNALYSIGKFTDEVIRKSFTSAFALFELISNIKEDNYAKRKTILRKIKEVKLFIDWQFPQEIAFNSFDYFDDLEINYELLPHIENMVDLVLKSTSFEELKSTSESIEINLRYFEERDKYLATNFIQSTENGIAELKALGKQKLEPVYMKVDGKTYDLSKSDSLQKLLQYEPVFNNAFTILAITKMLQLLFPTYVANEQDLEQLYNSYNGLADMYVTYFSRYSLNKYFKKELPSTNDFLDLAHLFYLRNHSSVFIVSDDKIFEKLGVSTIKTDNLILKP